MKRDVWQGGLCAYCKIGVTTIERVTLKYSQYVGTIPHHNMSHAPNIYAAESIHGVGVNETYTDQCYW